MMILLRANPSLIAFEFHRVSSGRILCCDWEISVVLNRALWGSMWVENIHANTAIVIVYGQK